MRKRGVHAEKGFRKDFGELRQFLIFQHTVEIENHNCLAHIF